MPLHTDKRYEDALQQLKAEILTMAGFVEGMVGSTIGALTRRQEGLAKAVIQQDAQVNQLEMTIDEHAVELLALHQPAASDLRFITMALRISKDLERMGDQAENIATRTLQLLREPPMAALEDLARMGTQVQLMVKQSLDAFVRQDAEQSERVCAMDDIVDNLNESIFGTLVQRMQADSTLVPQCVRLLSVSGNLERIADHATNIAEEVIFMVRGEDIRHQGK